jgi:hypothetical protein
MNTHLFRGYSASSVSIMAANMLEKNMGVLSTNEN